MKIHEKACWFVSNEKKRGPSEFEHLKEVKKEDRANLNSKKRLLKCTGEFKHFLDK